MVVFDKFVSWIPFNGFLGPLAMTYSTFFVSSFLKRVDICVIWKEIYTKILQYFRYTTSVPQRQQKIYLYIDILKIWNLKIWKTPVV